MKNKLILFILFYVLCFVASGCTLTNDNGEKSTSLDVTTKKEITENSSSNTDEEEGTSANGNEESPAAEKSSDNKEKVIGNSPSRDSGDDAEQSTSIEETELDNSNGEIVLPDDEW